MVENIVMSQRPTSSLLFNEFEFLTSRSSGPGGQNVNKVNTKVTLRFDVTNSQILTIEEKEIIKQKLITRLTTENVLILTSQEKRSQLQNKESVLAKFDKLLIKAFEKKKTRKPTRPSKGAIQNRIQKKKQNSEKKKWRARPE